MADSTSTAVRQVCGICGNTGVLFKCGRCKSLYYCSKICQAKDWPIHKMLCVKPNSKPKDDSGGVNIPQGILSFDDRFPAVDIGVKQENPQPTENTFCYAGSIMQCIDASDPSFVDLPVTHAIGFPMGVRGREQGLPIFDEPAMQLCISLDTKSAGFGIPFTLGRGGAVLARRDGLHIGICQVVATIEFVRRCNKEIVDVRMREAAGEKVDREELVKRLFNPAAFVKGFASIREKMMKNGQAGWERVECPVVVEDEKDEGATGSVTP
ncbi:hypothetical protein LTR56_013095 [Elasticomyces elasticus]|nr:hypothetical protein LTR56_013095 [Elasticomyces elasticus]KAK3640274.1 hypothetical protein LTR22_017109 [Elasticomyces elasticus]KAK4920551.1 hypothetical protein LTR49_011966 [Elasticomyces elasticus]KAK5758949.1 hypothetical protein LTS12_010890 [Elasticomyces elasticus]